MPLPERIRTVPLSKGHAIGGKIRIVKLWREFPVNQV